MIYIYRSFIIGPMETYIQILQNKIEEDILRYIMRYYIAPYQDHIFKNIINFGKTK